MEHNNWKMTEGVIQPAVLNYNGNQSPLARIVHWAGPSTGAIAYWWCPVHHRDATVKRIFAQAKMYPGSELVVSYDWPHGVEPIPEEKPSGYFEPYTVRPEGAMP